MVFLDLLEFRAAHGTRGGGGSGWGLLGFGFRCGRGGLGATVVYNTIELLQEPSEGRIRKGDEIVSCIAM